MASTTSPNALTSFLLLFFVASTLASYSCPKNSGTCDCNETNDALVFSCPSKNSSNSLLYTVTVDVNAGQTSVECSGTEMQYEEAMFQVFQLPSFHSVHLRNCPMPKMAFHRIFNSSLTWLSVQQFGKVKVLDGSLFVDLSSLTHLVIVGGEINSVKEGVFDQLEALEYLDLSLNGLKSLPDGIFDRNFNLTNINIDRNSLSRLPNVSVILEHLETFSFSENRLSYLENSSLDFAPHVKGLSLTHNPLDKIPPKMLHHLTNLTFLDLSVNQIDDVPQELLEKATNLQQFRLRYNRNLNSLPARLFANTKLLTIVDFSRNSLSTLPSSLLDGLSNLKELHLSHNVLTTLPKGFFADASALQLVDLGVNSLASLPQTLFNPLSNIKRISMSNNQLTSIGRTIFSSLPSLKELDVSNNMIEAVDKFAFQNSDNITFLDLSSNRIRLDKSDAFALPTSTVFLNVSYNDLDFLPLEWTAVESLQNVNLTHNRLPSIATFELLFKSKNVQVDLSHNVITNVNLKNVDNISETVGKPIVYVQENPFYCDCNLLSFVQFLKNRNIGSNAPFSFDTENLKCITSSDDLTKGQLLTTVDEDRLFCYIEDDCDNNCRCRQAPMSKNIEVRCEGKRLKYLVQKVPDNTTKLFYENNHLTSIDGFQATKWQSVKELHLSHNDLTDIEEKIVHLPKSLRLIALDNNKLETFPVWLMDEVDSRESLSVMLGNNPWTCGCTSIKFNKWLKEAKTGIVLDLNAIKCGPGTSLNEEKIVNLNSTNLCPTDGTGSSSAVVVSVLTIFILTAILGTGVYCLVRHRFQVKMWLFQHRMCLWLRTEDDIEHGHPL